MNEHKDAAFISIVIPVFNEENRIKKFLADVIDYLKKKTFSYEIIIVDDGSNDATVNITEAVLAKTLPGRYEILSLPFYRCGWLHIY